MKRILSFAAVLGLLVASSSIVSARGPGGVNPPPGQAFISSGKQPTGGTPGASGYSPGRQYLDNRTTSGSPGASVYAPGFLK